MSRSLLVSSCVVCVAVSVLLTACRGRTAPDTEAKAAASTAPVAVTTAGAVERPLDRFLTVTGTLNAQEEADVAAETGGRVVATPVERGTRVTAGSPLIRIADVEVEAQVREAEANAAQISARLGLGEGGTFEIDRVPEVANARAAQAQAEADFTRAQMLFERKLLSQSDYRSEEHTSELQSH